MYPKINSLNISSDFYSVQGEGISTGIPSYFIRLGKCNLCCGMSREFSNQLLKDKNLEDGEIFKGDLEKSGKATWTCDSTSQWLWRGEEKPFQYLLDRWNEQELMGQILNGDVRLIWTGGEPCLPLHQQAIHKFMNHWYDNLMEEKIDVYGITPYHEIETNGTIYIEGYLFQYLKQINCSPKLSNSGMSENKRIVPKALKRIMQHDNYQFKFVISNEDDINEMFRDYITPFKMPLRNIVCMPGMDSQEQFHERTQWVLEMAKKYGFRGLTRLHISAWDRTLDV
jgi:organic radical activating enzyme